MGTVGHLGSHKLLKLMRQQDTAKMRIREIAASLGQPLETALQLDELFSHSVDLTLRVVAHLLTKRNTRVRREEEELEILLFPALEIWLATSPKTIDLSPFLSYCPKALKYQYLKKLVIFISRKAADIEELVLINHGDLFEAFVDRLADAELLEAMGKLKHLKSLRIEEVCCIHIVDIIDLCQNLPKLEMLKFIPNYDIHELDLEEMNIADKMKSAMSNLKVLLFDPRTHSHSLVEFCIKHLENLRVINDYCDGFTTYQPLEPFDEIDTAPGESKLCHLLVDFENIFVGPDFGKLTCASAASFPMIKNLFVQFWPEDGLEEEYINNLLELPNVESLQFVAVPTDIVLRFVHKFCQNLRALKIEYDYSDDYIINLSFRDIFALCPKLERLSLGSDIMDGPSPIPFISELKEVKLDLFKGNRIKLSDILRAPALEKVTLERYFFDLHDLKKVTSMIAEKKILRNLHSLHFINCTNELQYFDAVVFKEIAALIKCVVDSIPALKVLTLCMGCSNCGYTALARSMMAGVMENEEIPGISEFFEGEDIDNECLNLFVDIELIEILDKYNS